MSGCPIFTFRLVAWTKGFTCSGVEGQDVCGLLRKALADEKLNIKVRAWFLAHR